jgi:hypothetical protein
MQFFVRLQYYKQQSAKLKRKSSEVTSPFGTQLDRSMHENDGDTTRVEVKVERAGISLNEVT